jgi:diaminopimelate decarboxylase
MWENKELPTPLATIQKAAEKQPTPFHIYDEKAMRANAQDLSSSFQKYFPDFKNYFAVKATPNPHILSILKEEGMGTDCSSLAELILSEKVGMKGEDIMFTSNDTPSHEYKKAIELGAIINIDDISHIDYLEQNFGTLPNLMCLRYNPGPLKEGNAIIGEPQQAKFGLTRSQVKQAYVLMKEKNVSRFGLHCMVASNELKPEYFRETAKLLFDLVVEVSKELDITIEFVNMGGGFGIPYRPQQNRLNFAQLAEMIYSVYNETVIPAGLPPIRIVTECGRVVTGPYGCLVTKVLHTKDTYKKFVGVDACMANLMRPGMYGAYHHISVVNGSWHLKIANGPNVDKNQGSTASSTSVVDVVGSLCENNDKFAVDRLLPNIDIGDILIIHDTGAHGHSMGFNYNGKLRSAELLATSSGDIVEIRRAETYDDLFATLNFNKTRTL